MGHLGGTPIASPACMVFGAINDSGQNSFVTFISEMKSHLTKHCCNMLNANPKDMCPRTACPYITYKRPADQNPLSCPKQHLKTRPRHPADPNAFMWSNSHFFLNLSSIYLSELPVNKKPTFLCDSFRIL